MNKISKFIALVTSVIFITSASQALELKFGHVGKPGSLFAESVENFAKIANAKLGSKAKVTVFGSSQLGNDKAGMQKLKLGTVDMWLPSSVMASIHDEFGVFDMPFIIKDRNHMMKVEKSVLPKMAKNLEAKTGYQFIGVWENGFRHITNNVRPINVPDDLKGIKLRTPKSKWRLKMFQSYGANPTPMAFSEVFTALKTGTMDGQENPYAQIASAKFQEVQKYLSITSHAQPFTPWPFIHGQVASPSPCIHTQQFTARKHYRLAYAPPVGKGGPFVFCSQPVPFPPAIHTGVIHTRQFTARKRPSPCVRAASGRASPRCIHSAPVAP